MTIERTRAWQDSRQFSEPCAREWGVASTGAWIYEGPTAYIE